MDARIVLLNAIFEQDFRDFLTHSGPDEAQATCWMKVGR
jgi:hypothetical protein